MRSDIGFRAKNLNVRAMSQDELKTYERERKAARRERARTIHFNSIGGNGGVKSIPAVTVPLEVPEVSVWSPKSVEHAKGAWQRMAHALHFAPPTIAPITAKGPSVKIRLQEIPARHGITSAADEDYRAKRNALQNAPSTRLVETAEQLGLKVEVAEVLESDMKVSGRIPSVRIMNGVKRAVENAVLHLQVQDYRDPFFRRGADASDAWQGRVLRYSPDSPKWDGVNYCIRATGKRTIAPPRPLPPPQVFYRVEPPIDVTLRRRFIFQCQETRIAPAINAYLEAIYSPSPDSAAALGATPVHRHGQWVMSILPRTEVR